jgi:predicted dehydrogenase
MIGVAYTPPVPPLLSPLKLAVVGVGRMGQLYARIASELPVTELVAVCGQRPEPVAVLARQLGVPEYSGGAYRQMLADHPEIDAVVVATPEWLHLDPALTVIGEGKHLLLEKPVATDLDEAQRIVDAAEAAGITLMVCHQLRFDPRFALTKEALDRGDIGELRHIYARRHSNSAAAARVAGSIPLTCWTSPHDLDLLLWLTGSQVISVAAHTHGDQTEPEGFFQATLRFASGVTAVFEQSWAAPRLGGRPRQALFDLRGTLGAIEVTPAEQGLAVFTAGTPIYPVLFDSPVVHGRVFGVFPALVSHFAECIARRRAPLTSGRDGLDAVRVAEAIGRALAAGREVTLD